MKADLQRFGQRQPACRALVDATYGIGGLFAVAVWSELGDCQRFTRSEQVVRHSGLDVTVDHRIVAAPAATCRARDHRRCAGRSTKQRRTPRINAAPTTTTTPTVKDRHDGKLATISMARKLARRCFHILRNLDPDVVYAMPT